MSDFPPPFVPPSLTVPLPPPEVGEGSPWAPIDAENRDRILDWWRAWWRRVFFPWLASFIAALNTWLEAAEAYIIAHAISGYSWRVTATALDPIIGHTTAAVFVVDQAFRPLVIGDLVMDEGEANTYGEITAVIDPTHATVTTLGTLKGLTGHGWWVTATPISASGTTDVVLTAEADRLPQVNDLVSDESSVLRYGIVTVVIDPTHVTVSPLGVLRGLPGFGWWATTTPITHSGTTDVVLSAGPDRLPQINDLVVDDTTSSAYGEITAVADPTHVTVAYVNTLQGPPGDTTGTVVSVVAGTGITVDNTDPENPVVSADLTTAVESVVAGSHVTVDSTDPLNPVVAAPGSTVYNAPDTLVLRDSDGYTNVKDPVAGHQAASKSYVDSNFEPVGGGVQSVDTTSAFLHVDNTDPHNPVVTIPPLDNPGLNAVYSYVVAFHNNQSSDGKWGIEDTTNTGRGQWFAGVGNAGTAQMGGGNTQGDSHVISREFVEFSALATTGTFAGDVAVVEVQPIGVNYNMISSGGRGPSAGLPQYEAVNLPNYGLNDTRRGALAFNLTTGRPCFYDGVLTWTDL
jgi:hypothetical protein